MLIEIKSASNEREEKTNSHSLTFVSYLLITFAFSHQIFHFIRVLNSSTMSRGYDNSSYQSAGSARYVSPNSMQKLQGQVDEVTDVMRNNIRLELERGAKLDDLQTKSEALSDASGQFAISARKVKQVYRWKNIKMWIILIVVIIIVIVIIVVASVLGSK